MTEIDGESIIHQVLTFWFGPGPRPTADEQRRWFVRDPEFDDLIRRTWGNVIEAAARRELDHWSATPHGALARIIALDQFPRNVFRDTPRAFAFDPIALEAAELAIASAHDVAVSTDRRAFFYLPLMHSESVDAQERCVELFERLLDDAPAEERSRFEVNLDFARRHRDIVQRFGRFPHRNAILGRESTVEEAEFLTQPGSSF